MANSTALKCWKVVTKNKTSRRVHYCYGVDQAEAAAQVRPLGDGWDIVGIIRVSEAEMIRNTNRR